ncbi:hypothetical protein Anas_10128 [Armadillidium nasatum]|uniref:Uncharacterized protein n=1 Tax=Armadillidium nasatum TaxID=96803 RepID=A0A5N5TKY0_9CRUS|nr:hypothetical protein Anas_10128 [Armadillidium nasatum]
MHPVEVHECSKVSLNKDVKENEIVSNIVSVNCNLNKDTSIDLKLTEEGKDNKHLEEVLIQDKDSSQESKGNRNSCSDMCSNKNFIQQEIVTQDDVDIVDPDLCKTNMNNSIVSKDDLNTTGSQENIFKNKLVYGNDYLEKNDESKIEDINTSDKLSSSLVRELIPRVVVSKLNQNDEPFIRDKSVSNTENFNTPKNAVSLLNNENFVKENFDFEFTNVTPEISLKHEKFSNCRVESPFSDTFLLEKNAHISDEQIPSLDSEFLITHEMLEEMVLKKVMHYNDDSIVGSSQSVSIKEVSNEDITPTYDKFVNEVNGCVFGNNSHITEKLTSHSQDSQLLITREIFRRNGFE